MENNQHPEEIREEEILVSDAQEEIRDEMEDMEEEEAPKGKRKQKKGAGKGILLAVLALIALALVFAALYLAGALNRLFNLNVTYSGEHAGLLANEIVTRLKESGKRYAVVEQTEVPKDCVQYLLPYVDGEYIAIPNKVIELHNGDTLFVDQIIWDRFEMDTVTLSPSPATLMEGETLSLAAQIQPAESFDTYLKWASSNEAVATVDDKGVVTAIGYGDAEITATGNNGTQGKAKIHVDIWPEAMSLVSEMGIAYEGDSQTLILNTKPDYAVVEGIAWESSDPAVATVDNKGVVTGVKGGTATITATAPNGTEASYTLEVQVEPTAVTLSETKLEQGRGDEVTLTATVSPAEADQSNLVWASSDGNVVTVTKDGVLNFVGLGSATVTATAPNGVEGKCDVVVDVQFEKAEVLKVRGKYTHGKGTYSITVTTNGCVNKVEFYNVGEDRKVATKKDEDFSAAEKKWYFSYPTWAHGGSFRFKVVAYSEAGSDSFSWTYKSEISGH
ncbi:MAG: Ig domain-containing protein [Clostridia bacterium]|nr:Ig domain-containing protein [Clostridia bacterium]